MAALSLGTWIFLRPQPTPAVTRFQIFAPPGSTLPLGTPAPSPDGKTIAYTVRGQDGITRIHVRALNSTESRALPGTENPSHPFWSPDSQSLAFVAAGNLKRIDLAGGSARVLTTATGPWHGSWSQFGVILFSANIETEQIPAGGGTVTPVVRLDEEMSDKSPSRIRPGGTFPWFLSDGKRFLTRIARGDRSDIELASLVSMERKLVLPNVFSAPILAPTPNGRSYLLYLSETSLMAREFDERSGTVRGSPFALVDSIGRVATPAFRAAVGVSASGILAYQTEGDLGVRQLAWFDRSGKLLSQLPEAAAGDEPSLSPDGRFVAVTRHWSETGGNMIWLVDLARGSSTRFTFGNASGNNFPVWSPDGKHIAYDKLGSGIYVKDADGTGQERALIGPVRNPLDWSSDGRQILFRDATSRLFLLPLSGGAPVPVPVGPESGSDTDARISPDRKYVAFSSSESGRNEVYVDPMPPGAGKWQISINGGGSPRWRRDGKELFFLSLDRKMMAVDIHAGQGIAAGIPRVLFQTATSELDRGGHYDVSADGQRFLIYSRPSGVRDAPITVVLNWWADLKNPAVH